jgi:hypothetical protein
MPDKDLGSINNVSDFFRHALPYLSTFGLACWGGTVHYFQWIRKKNKRFSWRDLGIDLIVSSFAGVITHLACVWAGIDGAKSAMLIAVSGHMGTRAIAGFYSMYDRIVRQPVEGDN